MKASGFPWSTVCTSVWWRWSQWFISRLLAMQSWLSYVGSDEYIPTYISTVTYQQAEWWGRRKGSFGTKVVKLMNPVRGVCLCGVYLFKVLSKVVDETCHLMNEEIQNYRAVCGAIFQDWNYGEVILFHILAEIANVCDTHLVCLQDVWF